MTKAHKPGSQKPGPDNAKATRAKKPGTEGQGAINRGATVNRAPTPKPQTEPSITLQSDTDKGKQSEKSRKSTIGGKAAPGARSAQPKEIKTPSPMQQGESYNREMRRRMQHMGMGPYSETPADTVRDRRQKRIEKKKQRQAEVKKTVVSKGPSTNIKLGRRNTYFLLVTIGIIALIIILALIIRHPF
jgi:hypothetical protein